MNHGPIINGYAPCYNLCMTLSLDDVRHIAELARLELTPDELTRYREQLSAVLDHFNKLGEVDTSAVLPAAGYAPQPADLRQDSPRPPLDRTALLQNAPDVEAGQFRVPPILE